MTSFTKEQIESALRTKSAHLGPEDVRRIADNKSTVMKMIQDFPPNWAKAQRQSMMLFELIEASATGRMDVHPEELKSAAGALIYLGAPLDIIPDDEADGYSDDAAVVGLAIAQSEKHVRAFCEAHGRNAAEYLD